MYTQSSALRPYIRLTTQVAVSAWASGTTSAEQSLIRIFRPIKHELLNLEGRLADWYDTLANDVEKGQEARRFVHVCMCMCMCMCVCVYVSVCMCVCVSVCVCEYLCVCACVCVMNMCPCMCACVCECVCVICMYIYIYAHICKHGDKIFCTLTAGA
jgi:hypothetical protein